LATNSEELKRLRDRIALTVGFLDDVEDLGAFGQELVRKADELFSSGDSRGLKLVAKQVDAFTIGLSQDQRDGLEAILKARLGVDKDQERAELKHHVAEIVATGRIAGAKQRRKLEDYLEALEATGGDEAEVAAIKQLLARG